MNTIPEAERVRAQESLRTLYRRAVPSVKGGIPAVLLKPEVVESWGWILLRLSRDITEIRENLVTPLIESLSEDGAVSGLIERAGARAANPLGYDGQFDPLPKIDFWKSHVTGLDLPNPWTTENLTDQGFVRNQLGEDFARELELAAEGGRTYAAEFQRRQEERAAAEARKFKGPNPYVAQAPDDWSSEAMSYAVWRGRRVQELQKQNPVLASWLQKVAQLIRVNPFERGGAWNMTSQMMIQKADAQFAELLERAGAWRTFQLEAESHVAEESARKAKARAEEARQRAATRL